MKFGRPDYDARIIDTAGQIPPEEPCLLIRGQDAIAPEIAFAYSRLARLRGDPAVADSAYEQGREMQRWQATKMVTPKTADLPDPGALPDKPLGEPAPDVIAFIRREHREAIESLTPSQIRAVRRLVMASGNPDQLNVDIAKEAAHPQGAVALRPYIPANWICLD